LAKLARDTDGFTGAEIQATCMRAALSAIREIIAKDPSTTTGENEIHISGRHLEQAIIDIRQERKKD
jgi:SpoVK/Ycf46/Vps4 family AAA+-type ATPase